jgi:molybdenum cofactor biosynthesis protein B
VTLRLATITSSDTRTKDTDEGGALLVELLRGGGYEVPLSLVVREDAGALQITTRTLVETRRFAAIVITGGTGVGPRDRTASELRPLFVKPLDGFGELFRQLSFAEIGPRGMLSNALAGLVGATVVYALPGSLKAIRLGVEKLILPTLQHTVALAEGRTAHGSVKTP